MKILCLVEEIINELQGISFSARIWQPILDNAIRSSKDNQNMTIEGKSHSKEYNMFPIDFIHFVVDKRYGEGAGYDEEKSGYDQDNMYHVYFVFGPKANSSSINHELKHAYEDFQRMSKGYNPMKLSKETRTLFGKGFESFMLEGDLDDYQPISTLIKGLYYTSKVERSAFSDTVYDNPYKNNVIDYISHLMHYANESFLLKKYKPGYLEKQWKIIKKKYNILILNKFNKAQDFIKWACNEIQYKGTKTLKKLRKVQYLGQQGDEMKANASSQK